MTGELRRVKPRADESADETAFAQFLRRHVPLRPVQDLDSLLAHQSPSLEAAWSAVSRSWPKARASPPYWAVAWPGGRALAKFVLDQPQWVRGRRVLELGCGGAVAAITAARSGAAHLSAVDIDSLACRGARANAAANGVRLEVRQLDLLAAPALDHWDLILAADLWYERFFAQRVNAWLRERAAAGAQVLLADLGRAFAPRQGLLELRRIDLSDPLGTEQRADLCVRIHRLMPPAAIQAGTSTTAAYQPCV